MTGPVAVVTGAARGIGLATAERLARDGWSVVLADIDERAMSEAARLAAAGASCLGVRADVTNREDLDSMVTLIESRFDQVTAIIANVGIGGPATPLLETPDDEVRRTIEVNLYGSLAVLRALTPMLRIDGTGRIVLIGSLFAQQPVTNAGPYIMSKDAVIGLTHALALELAPAVTVNAVSPGYIMTEMHRDELRARADRTGTTFEAQAKLVRAQIPLARHGEGHDIAAAIAFLVSADAAYLTGQTINVNGGSLLA